MALPLRLPKELDDPDAATVMKIVFNATNRKLFSKVSVFSGKIFWPLVWPI